jgi:hypothetical protein
MWGRVIQVTTGTTTPPLPKTRDIYKNTWHYRLRHGMEVVGKCGSFRTVNSED